MAPCISLHGPGHRDGNCRGTARSLKTNRVPWKLLSSLCTGSVLRQLPESSWCIGDARRCRGQSSSSGFTPTFRFLLPRRRSDQPVSDGLLPRKLPHAACRVSLPPCALLRWLFVEGRLRISLNTPSRCIFFFSTRSACSMLLSRTNTCKISSSCSRCDTARSGMPANYAEAFRTM
jgi:hypothetical protein